MWFSVLAVLAAIYFFCQRHSAVVRAQRGRARHDFVNFMAAVAQWAENESDLLLTSRAIEALQEHQERLRVFAQAMATPTQIARRERLYLKEYGLWFSNHNKQIGAINSSGDKDANDANAQASALQNAIESLAHLLPQS